MNKKYIIKDNRIINDIIKKSNSKISKYFIIYFEPNKLNHDRYCVSVGKKLCKANKRNYIKRVIKDILMKNDINNSLDCVIIVRKPILDMKYSSIKDVLIKELKELK